MISMRSNRATPYKRLSQAGLTFLQALKLIGFTDNSASRIALVAAEIKGPSCLSTLREVGALIFIENLDALCRIIDRTLADYSKSGIGAISTDLDFLSTDGECLGFFKTLNLAAMSLLRPTKKAAIVATIRNEGPFVLEWIAHHRAVGFEEFFIYTNDNTDGSLPFLQALDKEGVINLVTSTIGRGPNPQVKAYEHSLMLTPRLRDFEWVMYLDADEFVIPSEAFDFNIQNFLSAAPAYIGNEPVGSISLNWLWMGSDGALRRDNTRAVTSRFEVGDATSSFVKSIVRPDQTLSMRGVHKPVLRPGSVAVNSSFDPIDPTGHEIVHQFAGGEIRHYWNKSFEEFLVKQARGTDRGIWERHSDLFFAWDIQRSTSTIRPFPPVMKTRKEAAYRDLLKTAVICDAERTINDSYAHIVKGLCKGSSIETIYELSRKTYLLNIALNDSIPCATPVEDDDILETILESRAGLIGS